MLDRLRKFPTMDLGLLLIRLVIGVVFVFHGSQKLFGMFGGPGVGGFSEWLKSMNVPMPYLSAILAACVEFFGGLSMLSGLLVRLAALPLMVNMFVAISMVHWPTFSGNGGMEFPLTLFVVLAALVIMGPGKFSLDSIVSVKFGRKGSRG